MKKSKSITRRQFVKFATSGGTTDDTSSENPFPNVSSSEASSSESNYFNISSAPSSGNTPSSVGLNLLAEYGDWADGLYGEEPGELSFRHDDWTNIEEWKTAAKQRVSNLLVRPDTGGVPNITVIDTHHYEGLVIEDLSWQLPYGPETRAYLVKPVGDGPFPGIIAMHDHGGNKYFGRRKITRTSASMHSMMKSHQTNFYGGRALANELAKLGFAVLVPDVFTFASRRMLWSDTPDKPEVRRSGRDVTSAESNSHINQYNTWAAQHEHITAKSLFSAGLTWPGIFLAEDQRALDVLASRPEVDEDKLGCIGLSGGGLRTVILTGMDDRIKAGVCAGMMTTWRDYMLHHSFIHTWMVFVPHLPRYMDYSEIFSLNLTPCLVLNNNSDQIFDLGEMQKAEQKLKGVYDKAGVSEKFITEYYPGNHKFDAAMQDSAYDFLMHWLEVDEATTEPPDDDDDNEKLELGDNFPNPFNTNTGTEIPLNVPKSMFINLTVYNTLGKLVGTLVDSEMDAGEHKIPFHGTNLASGTYIYRLRTEEGVITKKMVLIK